MSEIEKVLSSLMTDDEAFLSDIQDGLISPEGISRKLSDADISDILHYLPKLNEDESTGWEFSQIDPYYQPKATCGPNDISLDEVDIVNLDPECISDSKLLVIYTGGTIGMKMKNGAYQPENNYFCRALRKLPMFHDHNINSRLGSLSNISNVFVMPRSREGRRVLFIVWEYDPLLDSSDITIDDYIHIARDIESVYDMYDGFVILHGTDTLAYTASSLSFILENLSKPVVVTGSQIPVFELRSDGRENLLASLMLASHYDIPEVSVFFHEKLYRANRCSKISSIHFNAFDSPNFPPLAILGVEITVNSHLIIKAPENKNFRVHTNFCPDVSVLRMFPSITCKTVSAFLCPPIQGVVLQTYGSGNVPFCRKDILQCFKIAFENGVIIINISQCWKGGVKSLYRTGSILSDCGVIPGMDMTPEGALSKLAYVLSKSEWTLKEKRLAMSSNLRGELTPISPINSFAKPRRPSQDPVMDKKSVLATAMCSAARIGDIVMLQKLGKKYKTCEVCDINGRTPLHYAAISNKLNVAKFLLLKDPVNINGMDKQKHTPLYYSVINKCNSELVKLLVEHGGSLGQMTEDLHQIINDAVEMNDLEVLHLFHLANFNFDIQDKDFNTPLHIAAINNNFNVIKFLTEVSLVSVNLINSYGNTAADEAKLRNHFHIFEYLCKEILEHRTSHNY